MIRLQNILVPTDFSEPSQRALAYGLNLARVFNSTLILAYIAAEPSAMSTRDLENLVPAEYKATFNSRTIVRTGNVEEELLRIVKDESIDLVVMGSHGRRYPERWFLGSVTEHILRKVPVPVLTVSRAEPQTDVTALVSLKKILYATDLSESSHAGVEYAMELARASGAGLTVLHVIDDEDRMLWGPALLTYLDRTKIVEEFRRKLQEFVDQESVPGVPIEPLCVEGKPYKRIVEIAEERNIDIIVLNMQSKGMLDRMLLGSTAERVVRLARTPVLSVPIAEAVHEHQQT